MGSSSLSALLSPLTESISQHAPAAPSVGKALVIAGGVGSAWAVARTSAFVSRRTLAWHDRRGPGEVTAAALVARSKRRETAVGVLRTGITYVAIAAAVVLGIGQLAGGVDQLTAIAGASVALLVAGFAIQRFLIDMIAGLTMFLEHWYSVGDTIYVPMLDLEGVVEDVSLRSTKLRTLNGEVIRIHNSQIPAVRLLPAGLKDLSLEFFVRDARDATALVDAVSALMPEGPTAFIQRPRVEEVQELSESLVRLKVRAAVAPGREWLVEDFLPGLLKERADEGLILHGPVVLTVDEVASRSFARATRSAPAPAGAR